MGSGLGSGSLGWLNMKQIDVTSQDFNKNLLLVDNEPDEQVYWQIHEQVYWQVYNQVYWQVYWQIHEQAKNETN